MDNVVNYSRYITKFEESNYEEVGVLQGNKICFDISAQGKYIPALAGYSLALPCHQTWNKGDQYTLQSFY